MTFDHKFGKCRPIYKFFHYQMPEEMLYTYITKILHFTLDTFLHYFVKLNNYNCCRF